MVRDIAGALAFVVVAVTVVPAVIALGAVIVALPGIAILKLVGML